MNVPSTPHQERGGVVDCANGRIASNTGSSDSHGDLLHALYNISIELNHHITYDKTRVYAAILSCGDCRGISQREPALVIVIIAVIEGMILSLMHNKSTCRIDSINGGRCGSIGAANGDRSLLNAFDCEWFE